MDLYRYFHPHHNPRLRSKALRQIEIAELELAVCELENALKRARIRTTNAPVASIRASHFDDLLDAAEYLKISLKILGDAHPGEGNEELQSLLEERANAPGWETWTTLLRQRLELLATKTTRSLRTAVSG